MLAGGAAFLLLLVALLAIPVNLRFQLSWRTALQTDMRLSWAFGLVRVRIPSVRPTAPSQPDRGEGLRSAWIKRSSRDSTNLYVLVRDRGLRRRAFRFVHDLWRALHKEDLRLRVRIGLGDPADTGRLWAILGPISGILANAREVSIALEPEFLEETFELDGGGSIRVIPLHLLYLFFALMLSPSVWYAIGRLRMTGQ